MYLMPVKLQARLVLRGNYIPILSLHLGQILLAGTVGAAAFFLQETLSKTIQPAILAAGEAALFLLSVWLIGAVQQGRRAWHYRLAAGKEASMLQVFYWLRHARSLRYRLLSLAVILRKALWFLLLNLPAITLLIGRYYGAVSGALSAIGAQITLTGAAVCGITGSLFTLVINRQYDLAAVILASRPMTPIRQAIRESRMRMQNRCLRMLLFRLSFLPWFLSCLLIVPIVYVAPYYTQCCMCRMTQLLKNSDASLYTFADADRRRNQEQTDDR